MKLRRLPHDDPAAVAAYVQERLAALDTTPKDRYWRRNALGMQMGEAIATAPRFTRLDIRLTVGEARIVNHAAKSRELGTRMWARSALATVLVACERVDPTEIPTLAVNGLLVPR